MNLLLNKLYWWLFRLKYKFHVWRFNIIFRKNCKDYEEYCKNNPIQERERIYLLPNQQSYDILREVQKSERRSWERLWGYKKPRWEV